MKAYETLGTLPTVGDTIDTQDDTYTVLATAPEKMLLMRHNHSDIAPVTYVVAHWPEVTVEPEGGKDFHWGAGHYFNVYRDNSEDALSDAMQCFLEL